jgi:hypothetical protein
MRLQVKILIVFYCISILSAHSLFPFLWDGAFYHLIALAFVFLTRIVWLLLSGSWGLVALVMHVTACNNLIDELFFDPLLMDWNEYLTLFTSVIIVCYNKRKWKKSNTSLKV